MRSYLLDYSLAGTAAAHPPGNSHAGEIGGTTVGWSREESRTFIDCMAAELTQFTLDIDIVSAVYPTNKKFEICGAP